MKVLVLSGDPGVPLDGPSGSSAHLRGIVRAFADAGHEVTVAVPRRLDGRGTAGDEPVPARIVTAEPWRWGFVPRRWRSRREGWDADRLALRALGSSRPELIYERHALWGTAGATLQERLGVPRIVEVNAPMVSERRRGGESVDEEAARREVRSLRAATRVVTVSAWLTRWAVDTVGCAPDRVRHVPNGVVWHGPGDRGRTRERLGLVGLVLGFVGSMKSWHGVERMSELLDAMPEASALVVGDGPITLAEHPRLRAVGRVAPRAVGDHVAAMDVALAPYRSDAPPWFCPLKMLEYRAQGVPIVAADIGDCRLWVGDGRVVGSDRLEAWVDAIRAVATSPRRLTVRTWSEVLGEALAGLPLNREAHPPTG